MVQINKDCKDECGRMECTFPAERTVGEAGGNITRASLSVTNRKSRVVVDDSSVISTSSQNEGWGSFVVMTTGGKSCSKPAAGEVNSTTVSLLSKWIKIRRL